ncbi:MAG: hypothetical protein JSV16_01580 [Candidatus Hydrogenedentota bacterium]|nr:MAG: hypothetical protein JSV16_01580 [Candidatus Hydrogenedentota bacterium]
MWPTIFEFSWDIDHMIFFGVFYSVVIVMATSLVYAFAKSIIDAFGSDTGADRHQNVEPETEDRAA